jgi:hypothetical protein
VVFELAFVVLNGRSSVLPVDQWENVIAGPFGSLSSCTSLGLSGLTSGPAGNFICQKLLFSDAHRMWDTTRPEPDSVRARQP